MAASGGSCYDPRMRAEKTDESPHDPHSAAFLLRLSLLLLLAAAAGGACWGEPSILPAAGLPPPRNEIVFLGDSLTAGYGLSPQEAFPAVIGSYWAGHGISLEAVNAGVSGDTTSDLLTRLDRAVGDRTYLVFLEIGPNDGFRRYDSSLISDNLAEIVRRLRARGIRVALAQMWLPMEEHASDGYRERFDAIYRQVGERFGLPLMPAFLRSLVAQGRYWQADGLHPTAEGDRILARDILAFFNPAWRLPIEPQPLGAANRD